MVRFAENFRAENDDTYIIHKQNSPYALSANVVIQCGGALFSEAMLLQEYIATMQQCSTVQITPYGGDSVVIVFTVADVWREV